MESLLNRNRPPVFCPGCSHERLVYALDKAFQKLALSAHEIVIVSDIGCSGLFDTFFNTHAFHGLHGRALTYAAGLKLACPELNVIVTMGDGGIGIGGAHFIAACRRNLNMTLLVLNNFNFGMTGGQYSPTTPREAQTASDFLNSLEKPLDIGAMAVAAGAPFAARISCYDRTLSAMLEKAVRFEGFSVIDTWGVCTGRYTKRNKLTVQMIDDMINRLEPLNVPVQENMRPEYGTGYRQKASEQKKAGPMLKISRKYSPPRNVRQEVVFLGSAGQKILTAGEILAMAGLYAGYEATRKNDFNITVLRGPSVSEVILSPEKIDFTGIENPTVIIALSDEGVNRRKTLFGRATNKTLILHAAEIKLPHTKAETLSVNFEKQGIRKTDRALASLAILAKMNRVLTMEMLLAAIENRFEGDALPPVRNVIDKV